MGRKPSPEIEHELNGVCLELHRALGLAVWEDDVLTDCDCSEPPAFLRTGFERDCWYKSRALRERLQAELNRRRKAQREARKAEREAKRAAQEVPSPPSPEQPAEQPPSPMTPIALADERAVLERAARQAAEEAVE
jgi:hypothetical protein